MTKKKVLSFIIMLLVVTAIMMIPKDCEPRDETRTTAVTEIHASESGEINVEAGNEDSENEGKEEQDKEPLGGISIGTSNIIVLVVLGLILALNRIRDYKSEQLSEKNE